jgi:hypothetical protein
MKLRSGAGWASPPLSAINLIFWVRGYPRTATLVEACAPANLGNATVGDAQQPRPRDNCRFCCHVVSLLPTSIARVVPSRLYEPLSTGSAPQAGYHLVWGARSHVTRRQ